MSRHILLIVFLVCGQFAFGQSGQYRGIGKLFDSLSLTYHLNLKEDGSYTMKSTWRDSLVTETGKWWKKGDNIKLGPKYSKAEKHYAARRTFVLKIEGDRLIWKPYKSKQDLARETRKIEREMSATVGEKVTLANKSDPFIFYKAN